jgi:hypothetical protein
MKIRVPGTLALVAVLALLTGAPAGAEEIVTYAGTIRDIDLDRGAFVVEDVGPWTGGQAAPITRRTIVLTPSTQIVEVRRAPEPDSGYRGDYRKAAISRADLVEGAFISVECTPTGAACRARELTLVRTGPSA